MRLLLDTHSFLWFVAGSTSLSATARAHLEDPGNDLFLSVASLWEMAIKISLGKLSLDEPFDELIPQQLAASGIATLPVRFAHVAAVARLPFHHRDPFDRMIIAQAQVDGLPVVGNDAEWGNYGIQRIW